MNTLNLSMNEEEVEMIEVALEFYLANDSLFAEECEIVRQIFVQLNNAKGQV